MKYNYIPTHMTKITVIGKTKGWQGFEPTGALIH